MNDPPGATQGKPDPSESGLEPVIVHLSGGRRGTTEALSGDRLVIGTGHSSNVRISTGDRAVAEEHALLIRRGATFEVETVGGRSIWVNGKAVDRAVLASGDVLELGHGGPVLRFRLYPPGTKYRKSPGEAFSDCLDCVKLNDTNLLGRLVLLLRGAPAEMATQTSWFFRGGVLIALAILAASTWSLTRRSGRIEESLANESRRVEGLATLLERTESRVLNQETLVEVQSELEQRLGALEERSEAEQRVILAARQSVIFLQGSYGFVDPKSGKSLHYAGRDQSGRLIRNPDGSPATALEGNGPPIEVLLTGTGFVATRGGLLLTNRHVALPWEFDDDALRVVGQGLEVRPGRFVGYLPDIKDSFEVEFVAASDRADLAVLRCSGVTRNVPALPLDTTPPPPGSGVLVLGYPTGIRALIARTNEAFVAELRDKGDVDFWGVARMLSEAGHIAPLASLGIVGQVTSSKVVYDAETTHGGSGGPVIDLRGNVVAINSAILPEFGGSNLGVPALFAQELLDSVEDRDALEP